MTYLRSRREGGASGRESGRPTIRRRAARAIPLLVIATALLLVFGGGAAARKRQKFKCPPASARIEKYEHERGTKPNGIPPYPYSNAAPFWEVFETRAEVLPWFCRGKEPEQYNPVETSLIQVQFWLAYPGSKPEEQQKYSYRAGSEGNEETSGTPIPEDEKPEVEAKKKSIAHAAADEKQTEIAAHSWQCARHTYSEPGDNPKAKIECKLLSGRWYDYRLVATRMLNGAPTGEVFYGETKQFKTCGKGKGNVESCHGTIRQPERPQEEEEKAP